MEHPLPEPGNPAHGCIGIAGVLGLIAGLVLLAAAAGFHAMLDDPIVRMPFVFALGGGGLFIGLAGLGLLILHRATRRR